MVVVHRDPIGHLLLGGGGGQAKALRRCGLRFPRQWCHR